MKKKDSQIAQLKAMLLELKTETQGQSQIPCTAAVVSRSRRPPWQVVGIGTLVEQEQRRSLKRGYEFNGMVVGEAGLGKTTLVNTLFRSPVARRCPPSLLEAR